MFKQEDIDFVHQLLDKNNFCVKVTQVKLSETYVEIMVDYLGETQDHYHILWDGSMMINDQIVFIDPALIRLYLILDIFKNMRRKKLPTSIIRGYKADGSPTTHLEDLFCQFSEENTIKELYATNIIKKIGENKKLINTFDDQLKEQKLYYSFNILKGLIV